MTGFYHRMGDGDALHILDIDHVFSILTYLESRRGEKVLACELRVIMPNYGRMMTIVRQLEEKELISINVETRPRKSYLLSLTPRGRTVAKKLAALDELILSPADNDDGSGK
jgi:DNA-binding MarR family transcriptional regulator